MTAPLAAPPYALPANEFPCPGLAAFVARAPTGGPRETALACATLTRLASAVAPPVDLAQELRRERAEAARVWLAALPLENALRATIIRAINATSSASRADIASELDSVAERLASVLDAGSVADLTRTAQRLRG